MVHDYYRPGGFGGLHRTPLSLSFFLRMNLHGTYVSHTHFIESRTPFVKKNPPLPEAAYEPVTVLVSRSTGPIVQIPVICMHIMHS
jgi:hypothetical protein